MKVVVKVLSALVLVGLAANACKKSSPSPAAAAPADLNASTVAGDVKKEAAEFADAVDTANSTDVPFDTAIAAVATVPADDPNNPLNQPNADVLVATGAVAGQTDINKAQAISVLNGDAPCSLLAPVVAKQEANNKQVDDAKQKQIAETQQAELFPINCQPTEDQEKIVKQNAFIATIVIGGIALAGAAALYTGRDLYSWFGADREARANSKEALVSQRAELELQYRELISLDPKISFRGSVRSLINFTNSAGPELAILDDLLDPAKRGNLTKDNLAILDGFVERQKSAFMNDTSNRLKVTAASIYADPKLPPPAAFSEYLKNISAAGADINKANLVPESIRNYLGLGASVDVTLEQKNAFGYMADISSRPNLQVVSLLELIEPTAPLHADTDKVQKVLDLDPKIEPAKRKLFAHYLAATDFLSSFPDLEKFPHELARNAIREKLIEKMPILIENSRMGLNEKQAFEKLAALPVDEKKTLFSQLEATADPAERRKIFSDTLKLAPQPSFFPDALVNADFSVKHILTDVNYPEKMITDKFLADRYLSVSAQGTAAINKAKMLALTEMAAGPARDAVLASLPDADQKEYTRITEDLKKAPTKEQVTLAQEKMRKYDRKINFASAGIGIAGAFLIGVAAGLGPSAFSANLALAGKKGNKYKGKPYAEQRKLLHQALAQICVKHHFCNSAPVDQ